ARIDGLLREPAFFITGDEDPEFISASSTLNKLQITGFGKIDPTVDPYPHDPYISRDFVLPIILRTGYAKDPQPNAYAARYYDADHPGDFTKYNADHAAALAAAWNATYDVVADWAFPIIARLDR